MVRKRYVFKLWGRSKDLTDCWGCPHKNKTLFYITDTRKGEEFFCCTECALKKYRIKKLKNLLKKYPIRKKKEISKSNPLIKNAENRNFRQVQIEFSPVNQGNARSSFRPGFPTHAKGVENG